jgi:hypothetical protein
MRGEVNPQEGLFTYGSLERRVPTDHPLRSIKAYADQALRRIYAELDALYGATGRRSVRFRAICDIHRLSGWG